MTKTLPDDELKGLDRAAHGTIAYLVVLGLVSFFWACIRASKLPAGFLPTDPSAIGVIALFGFSGSAVAALTSCLDRYAVGFEREDGTSFPAKAKTGEGKFNRRFARWLWVRPFLGALIAPVFIMGLRHFVGNSQSWIETVGFTAFVSGLLAKSIVDLIKNLFKNVFKV